MSKISCVIWDNDNTLVPTAEYHFRKHKEIAARYGITLGDDHRLKIAANNGRQNWEWLHDEMGLYAPRQQYLQEIDEWYEANVSEVEVPPEIRKTIIELKALEIPQAIFSNARRSSLNITVQQNDLARYMTLVWGKEDYDGRKNTPQPYKQLQSELEKRLGMSLALKTMLFIDDDAACIDSAAKAGMKTAHYLNGPDKRASKNPDRIVTTPTEIQEMILSEVL